MNVVEVTEEDILNGTRLDAGNCPIALALKRVFPDKEVIVSPLYLEIGNKRYMANKIIYDFVVNFDACEIVPLISFDLDGLSCVKVD